MKKPPSLREKKKQATRRALLSAATRHFERHGFEATTIDAICDEAGISRRTFFRYFDDKESLAFPHREQRLRVFAELLQRAPASESPITSLRRIAQIFAREYMFNRDSLMARQRLIDTSPALQAREAEIDHDWEQLMAHSFRVRAGSSADAELHARVLAGACIGVIRATMRYWFAGDGRGDLARLGDEALDCLERGFAHMPGDDSVSGLRRSTG